MIYEGIDRWNKSADKYLIHYNHNHDRLGRFARSRWGSLSSYNSEKDLGDIEVSADDTYRRREPINREPTNDIDDRGYTYVYNPANKRDDEFYEQFGSRIIDRKFGEFGRIAGYDSVGKAFCDHIFDTDDYHEVKYTDTMFKSAQKEAGESFVMSLLSAPYSPQKSPAENRSYYEDRLRKYGARTIGSGMGAQRHPWLDEEQREEGSRDSDTARNDAARRIADVLRDEGYIGMRDFKDIASDAVGLESATILFNKYRNMRWEY